MYNNELGNYVKDKYFYNLYKNINNMVDNDTVQFSNFQNYVGGNDNRRCIGGNIPMYSGTHMDRGFDKTLIPKADIKVESLSEVKNDLMNEKKKLQNKAMEPSKKIGGKKKQIEDKQIMDIVELVKQGAGAKILYRKKNIVGGRQLLQENQMPPSNMH
jgi:hypothetical protein